jgi:hypothetical protein
MLAVPRRAPTALVTAYVSPAGDGFHVPGVGEYCRVERTGSGPSDVRHTPGDVRHMLADEVDPGRPETSVGPDPSEAAVEPVRPDYPATAAASAAPQTGATKNMLPGRKRRALGLERLLMRLVATCGVVGIGVAIGAILVSSNVQGWITGLVVSIVSVVLSAILWSSRQL